MSSTTQCFGHSPRRWTHLIETFVRGLIFRYSEIFLIWAFLDDVGMGAETKDGSWKQLHLCLIAGKFLFLTFNPAKIDLPFTIQTLLGFVIDCYKKQAGIFEEKV